MFLPRILFVTCMPLEAPRSASMAFMGVLLEEYPNAFVWYTVRDANRGIENPYTIPYAYSNDIYRLARPRWLKHFLNLGPFAWIKGYQAAKFGGAQHVQVVLADLSFEAVVAGRVAAKVLGVPLLVLIHDDPVERIKVKGLPAWLVKEYEHEFAKTLHSATRCGVISDYMGEIYKDRYDISTSTLYIGVDDKDCLPLRQWGEQKNSFIIGSVGSIHSAGNWKILLEAIRSLNGKYGAGTFQVLHIGQLPEGIQCSGDVEVTGWLPEYEYIQNLARMDIGFLNWSFEPQYSVMRRTSFPLKIHSYIQAQVPMLALGPADSSVIRFVDDHACGVSCTVFDATSLSAKLEVLIQRGQYRKYAGNVEQLKTIFSRRLFFERFEHFVQVTV